MPAPIVTPLLQQRRVCLALLGLCAVVLAHAVSGLDLFHCPFHALTGRPCPGCGLTRALLASARGELGVALRFHPFVPLVWGGLALVVLAAGLPARPRARLLDVVGRLEARTSFGHWLASSLLVFGVWRAVWGAPL